MTPKPLNLLLLGRGKTGSLVAGVARERGHNVRVIGSGDNLEGRALAPEAVADIDVVIDFTTPRAVLDNIENCAQAGKCIVVGTTGWYDEMGRVREVVKKSGVGFMFAANFSVGVNLFFDIARVAATALHYQYEGHILERHHIHKKDAPSGTAVALRNVIREAGGEELLIESERQGEIVGYHELVLESTGDIITLSHNAKSRLGFAEGAVRAAEWLDGRRGFYDFKDVWRNLR
jgi:4-hydroxy-tetrahydrodipicolinate reductase